MNTFLSTGKFSKGAAGAALATGSVPEIFVDNFAGGGGASTGIEWALGRSVDHAINHDRFALGMHRINHGTTIHHCEDVYDIDPFKLMQSGGAMGAPAKIGGAWFSPDCKHFSKAKGGKPLSKKIRGLAFVMLRYAKARARVIYMENVEEIQTWGPLLHHPATRARAHPADCACGKPCGKPDPAHKGRTWNSFKAALGGGLQPDNPDIAEILEVLNFKDVTTGRRKTRTIRRQVPESMRVSREELLRGFGYEVQTRELRACDFGSPTIRKRLFMIARCDGLPIVWPQATHFNLAAREHKGAQGELFDAALDAPPGARNRPVAVRHPWRTVAECIDWSIPVNSIFLTREQARLSRCKRPLAHSSLRRIAMGIDRYVLKAKRPFLISLTHHGADRVESIDEPAKTLTGANRGEKALVNATLANAECGMRNAETMQSPFISEHANASRVESGQAADKPLRTQCAEVKGGHFSLIGAHMIQKGHLKSNSKMVKGADEPSHTVSASGMHHGLVEASMASLRRDAASGILIGSGGPVYAGKPKPVDQPKNSTLTESHTNLVTVHMAQANDGFNTNPGHAATEPSSTISAKGSQQQLIMAHISRDFGTAVGRAMTEPAPTATTREKTELITANITKYYGTDQDPRLDEPSHSATTRDRFGLTQCEVEVPQMSVEQIAGAHRVAAFLRQFGVIFQGEFASITVDGVQFVIVDIGMRMLAARELFRAQGFPDDYIIDRAVVVNPKTGEVQTIALTKEQQIRMCGNSVCPQVAEALVRANSPDMGLPQRLKATEELLATDFHR